MRWQWLARQGSRDVALIFGGWAMGATPFAAMIGARPACDVVFVEDYRDLEADLAALAGYDARHLIAWSFGVVSAAHWAKHTDHSFTTQTAINGTLHPVHADLGIPPAIFDATVAGLSPESFTQFCRRCYGRKSPPPPVDIPAARAELHAIAARGAAPDPGFDRIWISKSDRIIPPQNQRRAWQTAHGDLRDIDAPHAPFAQFSNLKALWA